METLFCPSCHRESPCPEQVDETTRCAHCDHPVMLQRRWRLEEMLGHGASGYTWKAVDTLHGGVVAIKELSFRRLTDLKQLELFEREARALASLNHRGIPTFIEHFVVEEDRFVSAYLVQEFIDGQVLSLQERTDEEEVLRFLEEMAHILDELQSRRPPVIHRDIKPSNVMRRADGAYVLIDFGSVRDHPEATTGGSTVAGTMGYMAPEQLMGRATKASDYYGLGATALALLAGQEAHHLIEHHEPLSWQKKVAMSDEIKTLLQQLLQPRVDDRLQTTAALRRAIRTARRGPPPRAASIQAVPKDATSSSEDSTQASSSESEKPADTTILVLDVCAFAVPPIIVVLFSLWFLPWLLPETISFLGSGVWPVIRYLFIVAFGFVIFGIAALSVVIWPIGLLAALVEDVAGPEVGTMTVIACMMLSATGLFLCLHIWYVIDETQTPPFSEIRLVASGEETRVVQQYPCGVKILDLNNKRISSVRPATDRCDVDWLTGFTVQLKGPNMLLLVDAFTGEILFDLSEEMPSGEAFQILDIDRDRVKYERPDGTITTADISAIKSQDATRILRPLSESTPVQTSLHRPEVVVPRQCGCADCGPIVRHYSTSFGDGEVSYSGLDRRGEPRWTVSRFPAVEGAFSVDQQCWIYERRFLREVELKQVDPSDGSMQRIMIY